MNTAAAKADLSAPLASRRLKRPTPLVESAIQFSLKPRPSTKEIKSFKELFYTLIFRATADDKKQMAASLASGPYTPRTIAIFFAMEELEIAAPVLLFSPVLRTNDLKCVLKKRGDSHARVIARRNNLEEETVRLLLERDDGERHIRRLLENNSSLKEDPAVVSLMKLPVSAFEKKEAEPEKVTLTELAPPETAKFRQMEKSIEAEHRQKDMSEELLRLAGAGGKIGRGASGQQANLVSNARQLELQLFENARSRNHAAFAWSIQQYCELDFRKVLDMVESQDAGMLATLLVALEIRKLPTCQLLLLMNRSVGRNAEIFRAIARQLDKLDPGACRKVFEKMGARFPDASRPAQTSREERVFSDAVRERRNGLAAAKPHRTPPAAMPEAAATAG